MCNGKIKHFERQDYYFLLFVFTFFVSVFTIMSFYPVVFIPLVISIIMAYILEPAMIKLEKIGINRTVAILSLFFISFTTVAGLGYLSAVNIIREFKAGEKKISTYATQTYNYIPDKIKKKYELGSPDKAIVLIEKAFGGAKKISSDVFKEGLTLFEQALSPTLSFLIGIIGYFITPIYLFYIMRDFSSIRKKIDLFIPRRFSMLINVKIDAINTALAHFIRGQILIGCLLGLFNSVALYYVGIDFAITIGMMAGLLFIIPYLGYTLGISASMIMAFLKFNDIGHPLMALFVFIVGMTIESAFLTPKIVGNKIGIHPVGLLISILLGGQVFGFIGMLIAVPFIVVIKTIFSSLFENYLNSDYYKNTLQDVN